MSRIAKNPIELPRGVECTIDGQQVSMKGSVGSLETVLNPAVEITRDGDTLSFAARDNSKASRSMAGTFRSLVNNMVVGVSAGFEKRLQLVGVGYRAQSQGGKISLTLGFSHPVVYELPKGVVAETPTQTEVVLKAADKQLLGQAAAEIRAFRPPEPYKGKGVRYSDERVQLKEAKKK
jgi:large subunit ribosomal protein L6